MNGPSLASSTRDLTGEAVNNPKAEASDRAIEAACLVPPDLLDVATRCATPSPSGDELFVTRNLKNILLKIFELFKRFGLDLGGDRS